MASLNLFDTTRSAKVTTNKAGGKALEMDAEHALAQYACAGFLGSTYYASAEDQLAEVKDLAVRVSPTFLAKVAVYARKHGNMKDMPALLLVMLLHRDVRLFKEVAPIVLDNGRMVRNFVQMLRSGQFAGRTNIPKPAKRVIQNWLRARTSTKLFRDSVGTKPSIADIVRMVHPAPHTEEQRAMFGMLLGKPFHPRRLPRHIQDYLVWKETKEGPTPDVEFRMLTSHEMTTEQWTEIALRAPWHALRMNLNTFARHGVWRDKGVVARCAERLREPERVRLSRCFPYQILTAYSNLDSAVPQPLREALQDAIEIAVENVPVFEGIVAVCPDVSGSMGNPITGHRPGATSVVTCVDVAALICAVVMRKNPGAIALPFDYHVREDIKVNPRDSIMTIAGQMSRPGGGTDVSAPVRHLLGTKTKVDAIWIVSDNESWCGRSTFWGHQHSRTQLQDVFRIYKRDVAPNVKLICQDIVANSTSQASNKESLNVAGVSDVVFNVVDGYMRERTKDHWVRTIEKVSLSGL